MRYNSIDSIAVTLTFSGKTANCSATVEGKIGTTQITAKATLYLVSANGGLTKKTSWNLSSDSRTLNWKDTYTVSEAGTYRLDLDITAPETAFASTSNTCYG